MENEKATTVNESMQFLTALAAATTKYYEARPDDSEKARVEYEAALLQFRNSLPAPVSSSAG